MSRKQEYFFIPDTLNIFLIKEFYNLKKNEETTTWKLASKFFPDFEKLNLTEQRAKNGLIKLRMKQMATDDHKELKNKLFFMSKGKDNKWKYELASENVKYKMYKFPGKRVWQNALCIKFGGVWAIYDTF